MFFTPTLAIPKFVIRVGLSFMVIIVDTCGNRLEVEVNTTL